MSAGQKPISTIRFAPSVVQQARRLAEQDGASLSAWIRRLVERELSRREGKCVTCGQPVPPGGEGGST